MAKEQTTGFEEPVLWQAIYGRRAGGAEPELRLSLPFAFDAASLDHIRRATAFLHEIQSIDVAVLPSDAVVGRFADEVLREGGASPPVGVVYAQNDPYPR